MHFISVCLNDTLSGLVLFAQGVIKVTGKESARLCAYVAVLSLSLNSMAQGNIACICTQRYIGARNIRRLSPGRQISRTVSLLIVNFVICFTSYLSSILRMKVSNNPTNMFCSTITVLVGSHNYIFIFYVFAIIFTVIADVLCFLTIQKLKKEISEVVVPIEVGARENSVAYLTKLNQQKAIFTVFIILVFINMSSVPSVLVYTLTILGVQTTPSDMRIVFISGFLNSIVNPIIICTRTQTIRNALKNLIKFRDFQN